VRLTARGANFHRIFIYLAAAVMAATWGVVIAKWLVP
jgi:hypothetical protein